MGKQAKRRNLSVKLITGLLYPEAAPELFDWARKRLAYMFGDIERISAPYPFTLTDYYRDISPNLTRRFFSFVGLRHPFGLVVWKKLAVSIEAESDGQNSGRRVNIDPGYVDGARLILASTKDNAHRVYLWDDIFAEVTLCRRKSGWESFSYTFPDFAEGTYDNFLDEVRSDWKKEIRVMRRDLLERTEEFDR
jgi:hypothetical protein